MLLQPTPFYFLVFQSSQRFFQVGQSGWEFGQIIDNQSLESFHVSWWRHFQDGFHFGWVRLEALHSWHFYRNACSFIARMALISASLLWKPAIRKSSVMTSTPSRSSTKLCIGRWKITRALGVRKNESSDSVQRVSWTLLKTLRHDQVTSDGNHPVSKFLGTC